MMRFVPFVERSGSQLRGRISKTITYSAIVFLSQLLLAVDVHPLECPRPPDQARRDWEVEVSAAVARIGPVKGPELKAKTRNETRELMAKLPDAGRIFLEQMLFSAYCSALKDDRRISEGEKANLLREYGKELRSTLTAVDREAPAKEASKAKSQKDAATTPRHQNLPKAPVIAMYTPDGAELNGATIDAKLSKGRIEYRTVVKNLGTAPSEPIYYKVYTKEPLAIAEEKGTVDEPGYDYEEGFMPGSKKFKDSVSGSVVFPVGFSSFMKTEHGFFGKGPLHNGVYPVRIKMYGGKTNPVVYSFSIRISDGGR